MSSLRVYKKNNNLLYAEMIISLLFFIISFAVIIRVFAAADRLEREERRRESASLLAQSAAEAYSVCGNAEKALELALGADVPEFSGGLEIGLNDELMPADGGEITLSLSETRRDTGAGVYSELSMSFRHDGSVLYSLKCSAYIPGGGAQNVRENG